MAADSDFPHVFSESVRQVGRELGEGEVTAWQIAHALLRDHARYGGGSILPLAGRLGRRQPFAAWLGEVADLFDPEAVSTRAGYGRITGRMTILALATVEPGLLDRIETSGVASRLRSGLGDAPLPADYARTRERALSRVQANVVLAAGAGPIEALAIVGHEGSPLVIGAGGDRAIRSWRLDGTPGPLTREGAHGNWIGALAVVEHEGSSLVISGSVDRAIKSWHLDGTKGPLTRDDAHSGGIRALAIAEHEGAPLVVSAGDDGAIRGWRLDGQPGPLTKSDAHVGWIGALAILEHEGSPLVVSAGDDGAIGSWRLDGEPGPLALTDAHAGTIGALAVVEHDGAPLLISAGVDRAVRSWRLDGTRGPLNRDGAHAGWIWALAILEYEGLPLVVSAGGDRAIQSWLLDGTPGPLSRPGAHARWIGALAIAEDDGLPLVVSAGGDGRIRLWDPAGAGGDPEAVELLGDQAAIHDALGRAPIAHDLARRLRRIHADPMHRGSFLVHIDGPWGAGKSSLLNFLHDDLAQLRPQFQRTDPPWLVVDFNAWRERRARPCWWALLTALRAAVHERLSWTARLRLRIAEIRERLSGRTAAYGAAVLVFGVTLIALLVAWIVGLVPHDLQAIAGVATALLGAAGLIQGLSPLARRFGFWDSANRARAFEQTEEQPMRSVSRHFSWLIDAVASGRFELRDRRPHDQRNRAAGQATVFLIDDLDRCEAEHVVEFLEAIQNLIRDAGATHGPYFVVAADGRWLRRSYEAWFDRFNESIREPGRPLGYLFLDKLFQMSVQVPSLRTAEQAAYFGRLLGVTPADATVPSTPAAVQPTSLGELLTQVRRGSSEEDFTRVVEQAKALPADERRQVVSEVVAREAGEVQAEITSHRLEPYAAHLPANPRTMKRFLNAYEIARAIDRVEGRAVTLEQRALWTIIRLRWPLLADHLEVHPSALDTLDRVPRGQEGPDQLLRDEDVLRLLREAKAGGFSAADLHACRGRAAPTPTEAPAATNVAGQSAGHSSGSP